MKDIHDHSNQKYNQPLSLKYIKYDHKHLDLYLKKLNNLRPVLINFITRYFTFNYFSKYRGQFYLVIERILNFILPFGTLISAKSPTDLPSNPLPIGEFTDILPLFKSASLSATSW